MPPISAEPWTGSATAHGTIDPAAAGDLEPRPALDRTEPAREERDARGQRHEALLAGTQPRRAGFAVTETPAIPLRRRRDDDRYPSRGDVPDRDPAHRPPARLVGRAEADGGRIGDDLGGGRGTDVDDAAALGGDQAPADGDGGADERSLQGGCVELGSRLCEDGGRAAGERRGRARAADRAVARGLIVVPARIGGDELDAGGCDLRLDAAAEREAVRGERCDRRTAPVVLPAGRAERDANVGASRDRRAERGGRGGRETDHRDVETVVEAERAGRDEAVDEDRLRAREHGRARVVGGPVRPREERRTAGDDAVAVVVEVAGKRRPARPGGDAPPRPHHRQRERRARRGGATERQLAVEQDAQPRPNDDANDRSLAAEICCADGERGGRTAGTADAAVPRPGRALVPRRDDDQRVQPGRARDRARDRPVGERGERLGDADDRDAGRVEHVAVGVGVDGQLEAGEQLVGPAVDGEPAFGVRLPAGDADRQDRRAGRDAPDTTRTAAADEQARDLRAVTLESHRLVRVCSAQRARASGSSTSTPSSSRSRMNGCVTSTPVSSKAIVTPRPSNPGSRSSARRPPPTA